MADYLKRNGLYPSSTYFFLRIQPRYLSCDEFEGNTNEATGTESSFTAEESCVVSVPAPAKATDQEVCKVYNCTFQKSQSCLRCEQNHEHEESPWADAEESASQELQSENSVSLLSMEEMREFRSANFQKCIFCPHVQSNVAASQEIAATSNALHREDQRPLCAIVLCLFDAEVSDSVLLESFIKYLSQVEKELAREYLQRDCFPEENEELLEFLERFNCRTAVTPQNPRKVPLEIANQELIQKSQVMISTWQPSVQELKQYPQFQGVSGIQGLYDTLNPTNKKVLETLVAQPNTDAECDALKFLQLYIRGLDNGKPIQFLRFTTASDVFIVLLL